jgi:hypothetical protein
MRECFRCGEAYDEKSFLVKVRGRDYQSSLCRKCSKEDGIEIIERCPKCWSLNVHESQLHECPSGKPMRCDDCYHTYCV